MGSSIGGLARAGTAGMGKVLRGLRNVLLLARANPVVAAVVLVIIGGCWHLQRTKKQQAQVPIETTISGRSGQLAVGNPVAIV